jgi:hypothetical protein
MVPGSDALFGYLLDDLSEGDRPALDNLLSSPSDDYFPDASVRDIYKLRLLRSFYKKLVENVAVDADARCLDKFLAANSRCKEWRLNLSDSRDEILYGELKRELHDFFYPEGEPLIQSYFDVLRQGRAGPGSSLGAIGEDFYSKFFSSQLTATSPELYKLYSEYVGWYSNWCDAELVRLYALGYPTYVECNSLSYVRKTRDISRSICTEPSLNMFFQLGLGRVLETRLVQSFGIDLSAQPDRNRHLAYVGSKFGTIATIDLESASDGFSMNLMADVLPDYIQDVLCLLRSPKVRIGDSEVMLHMVSSMGNGFTFPLQTILFACVVRACASFRDKRLGLASHSTAAWGVFGDDIACPTELAGDVCRLLRLIGFRVNGSKSYLEGPFRESCGHDYFLGHNVRGVYLKSLLSPQDRYVAINLLNEWSARSGITLPRTVGYLKDSVRDLAIPPFESPDAGIRYPVPPPGLWSSKKQRYYYRCYEPVQKFLQVSEDPRVPPYSHANKRLRKRIFNPSGLLVAFLGGYINNMRIALALKQGERVAYRTRTKVAPFWGPSLEQSGKAPDSCFWQRWNAATELNLSVQSQD